jgi:hypothetical protein
LAIKPKESDTFLREVDEELRKEQLNDFFTRWGKWVIGGALLLLAAIGGFIYWQHRQAEQAQELSTKLVQVIGQIEANNARGAAATIDDLAASDRDAYRYAGLFSRANAQVQTGAIPAAIATLRGIADDANAPQPYRDAALIRLTQLEFDNLTPAQAVARLRPYAQAGNPFHGAAGELLGIAFIRGGQPQQAAPVFVAIARDTDVPESIRARAIQMASSLGVDASELDPSIMRDAESGVGMPASPVTQQPPAAPAAPAGNQTQGTDVATRNAAR